MKRLLWTVFIPTAALFAAIGVITSPARAVLPVGGGGETCAVDYVKLYPLTNQIKPGEMVLESHIVCNRNASIQGSQSLLEYWPWGWVLLANTTHTEPAATALADTMISKFKCGGLSSLSSQIYRGVAAWYVKFPDGFVINMGQTQTYSAAISSKCMSPGLDAFS